VLEEAEVQQEMEAEIPEAEVQAAVAQEPTVPVVQEVQEV
jgi:hypothetical protein